MGYNTLKGEKLKCTKKNWYCSKFYFRSNCWHYHFVVEQIVAFL